MAIFSCSNIEDNRSVTSAAGCPGVETGGTAGLGEAEVTAVACEAEGTGVGWGGAGETTGFNSLGLPFCFSCRSLRASLVIKHSEILTTKKLIQKFLKYYYSITYFN